MVGETPPPPSSPPPPAAPPPLPPPPLPEGGGEPSGEPGESLKPVGIDAGLEEEIKAEEVASGGVSKDKLEGENEKQEEKEKGGVEDGAIVMPVVVEQVPPEPPKKQDKPKREKKGKGEQRIRVVPQLTVSAATGTGPPGPGPGGLNPEMQAFLQAQAGRDKVQGEQNQQFIELLVMLVGGGGGGGGGAGGQNALEVMRMAQEAGGVPEGLSAGVGERSGSSYFAKMEELGLKALLYGYEVIPRSEERLDVVVYDNYTYESWRDRSQGVDGYVVRMVKDKQGNWAPAINVVTGEPEIEQVLRGDPAEHPYWKEKMGPFYYPKRQEYVILNLHIMSEILHRLYQSKAIDTLHWTPGEEFSDIAKGLDFIRAIASLIGKSPSANIEQVVGNLPTNPEQFRGLLANMRTRVRMRTRDQQQEYEAEVKVAEQEGEEVHSREYCYEGWLTLGDYVDFLEEELWFDPLNSVAQDAMFPKLGGEQLSEGWHDHRRAKFSEWFFSQMKDKDGKSFVAEDDTNPVVWTDIYDEEYDRRFVQRETVVRWRWDPRKGKLERALVHLTKEGKRMRVWQRKDNALEWHEEKDQPFAGGSQEAEEWELKDIPRPGNGGGILIAEIGTGDFPPPAGREWHEIPKQMRVIDDHGRPVLDKQDQPVMVPLGRAVAVAEKKYAGKKVFQKRKIMVNGQKQEIYELVDKKEEAIFANRSAVGGSIWDATDYISAYHFMAYWYLAGTAILIGHDETLAMREAIKAFRHLNENAWRADKYTLTEIPILRFSTVTWGPLEWMYYQKITPPWMADFGPCAVGVANAERGEELQDAARDVLDDWMVRRGLPPSEAMEESVIANGLWLNQEHNPYSPYSRDDKDFADRQKAIDVGVLKRNKKYDSAEMGDAYSLEWDGEYAAYPGDMPTSPLSFAQQFAAQPADYQEQYKRWLGHKLTMRWHRKAHRVLVGDRRRRQGTGVLSADGKKWISPVWDGAERDHMESVQRLMPRKAVMMQYKDFEELEAIKEADFRGSFAVAAQVPESAFVDPDLPPKQRFLAANINVAGGLITDADIDRVRPLIDKYWDLGDDPQVAQQRLNAYILKAKNECRGPVAAMVAFDKTYKRQYFLWEGLEWKDVDSGFGYMKASIEQSKMVRELDGASILTGEETYKGEFPSDFEEILAAETVTKGPTSTPREFQIVQSVQKQLEPVVQGIVGAVKGAEHQTAEGIKQQWEQLIKRWIMSNSTMKADYFWDMKSRKKGKTKRGILDFKRMQWKPSEAPSVGLQLALQSCGYKISGRSKGNLAVTDRAGRPVTRVVLAPNVSEVNYQGRGIRQGELKGARAVGLRQINRVIKQTARLVGSISKDDVKQVLQWAKENVLDDDKPQVFEGEWGKETRTFGILASKAFFAQMRSQ